METIVDVLRLRRIVAGWRREGDAVGFVPTMGALHEGHLSLVRLARERADRAVASVFVNPTQFGPGEDFGRYPRSPARDGEMLASAGCDLLFLPAVETIYPPGHATFVTPGGAAEGLEGERRPGHFRGVATVVTQLFNLVQPDLAVFGEKDAQQLAVVRQLVRDLHLPLEVVAGPTLREPDGLAMSSRNAYLSAAERQVATVLYRALRAGEALVSAGERAAAAVCARIREVLASEPLVEVDYVAAVDAESFQPLTTLDGMPEGEPEASGTGKRSAGPAARSGINHEGEPEASPSVVEWAGALAPAHGVNLVLPIAVTIGRTRLIDNLRLRVPAPGVPLLPL